MVKSEIFQEEGYQKAFDLLKQCATPNGFLASTTEEDNYRRVWSRDGVIIGLAGLLTGDESCQKTFLATLRTLRDHQGPHGEIPSNVDVQAGRISYGGTTGRVDANLWYIIGCCAYWKATQDENFLDDFQPSLEKVLFLLGAWEFNTRGLLYVPQTGDWTDEYIQHGYILYDQLLYWRALHDIGDVRKAYNKEADYVLHEKIGRLQKLIAANYWFENCDLDNPDAYHPVLHKQGCKAAHLLDQHWMAFFSPTGYGYRFDALANILVSLFGIATKDQQEKVDAYIEKEVVSPKLPLLPAFHPVIDADDEAWGQLQVSFSYSFKNKPYEFHNGGLWPFVTGFYVADLARRGKKDLARRYLDGINTANAMAGDGGDWGFYEYIHGKHHTPGGTRHQGWSAAGAVIGYHALNDNFLLA